MELTLEDRIDYYLLTHLPKEEAGREDRLIRRCIEEMHCVREEVDRRIAFLLETGLVKSSPTGEALTVTRKGEEYLQELERLHGWSPGSF